MTPPEKPMLSVCTIAYNVGPFIRDTIEGVLAQKVDFDMEYVICEDASTDDTAKIIQEYADRRPDLIRFTRNEKNLGLNPNFIKAMRQCRGKYVALLDGDDYWTDPNKLQMQVDFLEAHPECSFCGTATRVYYQDRDEFEPGHPELPDDDDSVQYFDVDEMYKPWLFWIPTHSLVLRNEYVEFPPWFDDAVYVDRALRLFLAMHGKAAYINRTTCVYRKHGWNLTNTRPYTLCRRFAELYVNVYHFSGKKHYKIARGAVNESLFAERIQIRRETKGWKKLKALCSNTFYALKEFRITTPKDLLRFPYHFLFTGDVVDGVKRLMFGALKEEEIENG